jgi:hypothetical protein
MSELDGLAQPSLSIGDANLSIGTFSDVPRTKEERWRAESGPAIFSPCHLYRYTLSRTWEEELPRLVVIGLNPSTADHRQLDPTLRRVRNFAQAWGLGGFVMLNLFAFRATEPRDMKRAEEPVGPMNDRYIRGLAAALNTGMVLAAWGGHGGYRNRDREVMAILAEERVKPYALRVTRQGYPSHPLYIPGSVVPQPYVCR